MSVQPAQPVSIFYCYAPQDEALRQQLDTHLSLLRQQGIISAWYASQVLAGGDWLQESRAHLSKSQIILLLVSADFLNSDYNSTELQQAMERENAGEVRIIPIIVRDVDWELAPFTRLTPLPTGGHSITGDHWRTVDQAWSDVARGIRKVVEELANNHKTLSPSLSASVWTVPYRRNPFFTGREALLKQLHERLTTNKGVALNQAAINGLGGIGKTQTAVEYAYRHRKDYTHVLWIRATAETMTTDIVALANHLNLPEQNLQDQSRIVAAVKHWLETHTGWLLILDNADDLELARTFVPIDHKGAVLLTTRAQATGAIADPLAVEKMSQDEGVLLLLRRSRIVSQDAPLDQAKPDDRKEAAKIVQELDGLPLAIEQAGAYIEYNKCGFAKYSKLYQKHRADLLAWRTSLSPDYHGDDTVATTWSLSFKQVETTNPAAADLLRLCSFLDPDAIPLDLFSKKVKELDAPLKTLMADDFALDAAIALLQRFSLLKRIPDENCLSMHRLVQVVLKDNMDAAMRQQWAEYAVHVVYAVFPNEQWQPVRYLLPQALVCATLIEEYQFTFKAAAFLLHNTANSLRDYSQYTQAEAFYQHALRIYKQLFSSDGVEMSTILHNLAMLYTNQGRYEQAEQHYELSLAIKEKVLPAEQPSTAATLHQLGNLRLNQEKYEEAEQYYERALAIKEKILPAEHPSIATTLYALGLLRQMQRDYDGAEQYYERTLAIEEKILPAEHPSIATTYYGLAYLYQVQKRYDEAEPFYQRALAIREKTLPPNHPDIADLLSSYASLLRAMNSTKEAAQLEARARSIREQRGE